MRLRRGRTAGLPTPRRQATERPPPPAEFPAGITHRRALSVRSDDAYALVWSPDGRYIASGGEDKVLRVWDAQTGESHAQLDGHSGYIHSVSWSPDGRLVASAGEDRVVRVWDAQAGQEHRQLIGQSGCAYSVSWSPDGRLIASAGADEVVRVWNAETAEPQRQLQGHTGCVASVSWSPDGRHIAAGGEDEAVHVWDAQTGEPRPKVQGHTAPIRSVSWSPDGRFIAAGGEDKVVRVWDAESVGGRQQLEAHTSPILCLSWSRDGRMLSSLSYAGRERLWQAGSWENIAVIDGRACAGWSDADHQGFHPTEPLFATLGKEGIEILDLDYGVLLGDVTASGVPAHYANARVVLVGDTGVGKTGLARALMGEPHKATDSTHGRRVWTLSSEEAPLNGHGTETRETLLWDLAGQPGYRVTHQLYLDEVAVALVVMDARHETDPFVGVPYWARALRQARQRQGESGCPMKVYLVSARTDRTGPAASEDRIAYVIRELGLDGYYATSAKAGWGIDELRSVIRGAIEWDTLPKVSSTDLFRRIQRFLVAQKEEGRVLATVEELHGDFQTSNEGQDGDVFPEFEACIDRVQSRGLIRRLRFGDFVLLQPEYIDAYASSIVNAARTQPDGDGCILESRARGLAFEMASDARVEDEQVEGVLLAATIDDLLYRELALQQRADDGDYLVFPSEFGIKHPDMPDPEGSRVAFGFEGAVHSIYATLAVRLAHSDLFEGVGMWRNAATYAPSVGGHCGMFLSRADEGSGELTLFFDPDAPEFAEYQFEQYVRRHLDRKAVAGSVVRRRLFTCSQCGERITDTAVARRRARGDADLPCPACDTRVSLLDGSERLEELYESRVAEMDRAAEHVRDVGTTIAAARGALQTEEFRAWVNAGVASAGQEPTVALVFTDVVGSTSLGVELGDRAGRGVLQEHMEQLARLTDQCGGAVVNERGDGAIAVFPESGTALDFALGLHSATISVDLMTRVAIHVGPVRLNGGDVSGTALAYWRYGQELCMAVRRLPRWT
ncbi:hypothetical protein HN371_29210, partial [Candidatus Poribacteria bacterium]|nr:hypothetical protein [Candidatus Poribacteria bacterium]